MNKERNGLKAWLQLLAVPVVSLAAGIVLAPPLFNGMIRMGRAAPWLAGWRNMPFEPLATRVVLFTFMLLLAGLSIREGWFRSALAPAGSGPRTVRSFALWLMAAAGSVLVVDVWAVSTGVYVFRDPSISVAVRKTATWLLTACVIGLVEETLFRGLLYRITRRAMAWPWAAVFVSVLFALLHFARPLHTEGVVYGHWYSGLELLRYTFGEAQLGAARFFPYALTLFFMSLALCVVREVTGHIYVCAGLHAGWVWIIQAHDEWFSAGEAVGAFFLEPDATARSGVACFLMGVSCLVAIAVFTIAHRKAKPTGE